MENMKMTTNLIKTQNSELTTHQDAIPEIVLAAGPHAQYAWEEFFDGNIRNKNTNVSYKYAVNRFLKYCECTPLAEIRPGHVSRYLDNLHDTKSDSDQPKMVSASTRKLHLAAIRHFFDFQVMRHAIILNPATSVRGDKLKVVEGRTTPIKPTLINNLLASIDRSDIIGQRDYNIIAILAATAVRIGTVAHLRIKDFYNGGDQWYLHFEEKGGKLREIPVRHDLGQSLSDYRKAAGMMDENSVAPLFRASSRGRGKWLTENAMTENNIWRMIKRRLKVAGLPTKMTPHSFRAGIATHLLEQGVSLEDVQMLLGHADPRTTKIYDHREREVTRNIVERIAISI